LRQVFWQREKQESPKTRESRYGDRRGEERKKGVGKVRVCERDVKRQEKGGETGDKEIENKAARPAKPEILRHCPGG